MYQSKWNGEFDKAELMLYEEVTKMPPFKRRTLALIGTTGVGRRTLKGRLINSDPDKFAGVIPCKYSFKHIIFYLFYELSVALSFFYETLKNCSSFYKQLLL